MPDFCDRAQHTHEQSLTQALKAHVLRTQPTTLGTDDCIHCGDPIPLARRQAVPNAQRCLECQQITEKQKRLWV